MHLPYKYRIPRKLHLDGRKELAKQKRKSCITDQSFPSNTTAAFVLINRWFKPKTTTLTVSWIRHEVQMKQSRNFSG